MPAAARPEPEIASAMPAQPQWNSSAEITCIWPSRVGGRALDPLEAAEALLAGLFDDLPGDALLAVVLGGRGADHLAGESPAFLLVLELLVVECEIHWFLPRRGPIDWSVSQSPGTLSDRPARTRRVAFPRVSADRPINADVPRGRTSQPPRAGDSRGREDGRPPSAKIAAGAEAPKRRRRKPIPGALKGIAGAGRRSRSSSSSPPWSAAAAAPRATPAEPARRQSPAPASRQHGGGARDARAPKRSATPPSRPATRPGSAAPTPPPTPPGSRWPCSPRPPPPSARRP